MQGTRSKAVSMLDHVTNAEVAKSVANFASRHLGAWDSSLPSVFFSGVVADYLTHVFSSLAIAIPSPAVASPAIASCIGSPEFFDLVLGGAAPSFPSEQRFESARTGSVLIENVRIENARNMSAKRARNVSTRSARVCLASKHYKYGLLWGGWSMGNSCKVITYHSLMRLTRKEKKKKNPCKVVGAD